MNQTIPWARPNYCLPYCGARGTAGFLTSKSTVTASGVESGAPQLSSAFSKRQRNESRKRHPSSKAEGQDKAKGEWRANAATTPSTEQNGTNEGMAQVKGRLTPTGQNTHKGTVQPSPWANIATDPLVLVLQPRPCPHPPHPDLQSERHRRWHKIQNTALTSPSPSVIDIIGIIDAIDLVGIADNLDIICVVEIMI